MSFFRLAIYICIALILMSLFLGLIDALNIFPVSVNSGVSLEDRDTIIYKLTSLSGGWGDLWVSMITLTGAGALLLAWAIGSFIPIGIWIFGSVFWTSYTRAQPVLNVIFNSNNFGDNAISSTFLLIIDIVIMFIFIAACLGISNAGE